MPTGQSTQQTSGHIVVLSYLHGGGEQVQQKLSDDAIALTTATGLLAECATVARTWKRIEGGLPSGDSKMALATIRSLISAQLAVLLAHAGKRRWCELATVDADAVLTFCRVYPTARVVCVHRSFAEFARTAIATNPWGFPPSVLSSYLASFGGNTLAALASYWVDRTDGLLRLEELGPTVVRRLFAEHVEADVASLRTWLGLGTSVPGQSLASESRTSQFRQMVTDLEVPVEFIPGQLLERIEQLQKALSDAR